MAFNAMRLECLGRECGERREGAWSTPTLRGQVEEEDLSKGCRVGEVAEKPSDLETKKRECVKEGAVTSS